MTFKEKLVKLRKLKGITQDEFASAVGVSRQAVYKWESGQSYPEVTKLIEMKALFGISIDDLLDENYEVIVPEKKKKRLSAAAKRKIEEKVEAEENKETLEPIAVAAEAPKEVVEEAPVAEVAPVSEPSAVVTEAPKEEVEAASNEPKPTEAPVQEKTTEKKGFFSKLFGRR